MPQVTANTNGTYYSVVRGVSTDRPPDFQPAFGTVNVKCTSYVLRKSTGTLRSNIRS